MIGMIPSSRLTSWFLPCAGICLLLVLFAAGCRQPEEEPSVRLLDLQESIRLQARCESTATCSIGYRCVAKSCLPEGCGDSRLGIGEECDDGNLLNGDGCSRRCWTEANSEHPPQVDPPTDPFMYREYPY